MAGIDQNLINIFRKSSLIKRKFLDVEKREVFLEMLLKGSYERKDVIIRFLEDYEEGFAERAEQQLEELSQNKDEVGELLFDAKVLKDSMKAEAEQESDVSSDLIE